MVILPTITTKYSQANKLVIKVSLLFVKSLASTPKQLDMIAKASDIIKVDVQIPNTDVTKDLLEVSPDLYTSTLIVPEDIEQLLVRIHVRHEESNKILPYDVYMKDSNEKKDI